MRSAFEVNGPAIEQAAEVLSEAIATAHAVYAFGAGHSISLVMEMYHRAGGLKVVQPIWNEELLTRDGASVDRNPETVPGYAGQLVEGLEWGPGDAVWVISNSGRNALPVEVALAAKGQGVRVIALLSSRHAAAVPASPGLPKLSEVADVVLDNRGELGDACLALPGVPGRVAPTSTILGATLIHAVWAEVASRLAARGEPPEVYASFNLGPVPVDDPAKDETGAGMPAKVGGSTLTPHSTVSEREQLGSGVSRS